MHPFEVADLDLSTTKFLDLMSPGAKSLGVPMQPPADLR